MKPDIHSPEGELARSRQLQQERAHEAAPLTPSAPEVAAPPVALDGLCLSVQVPNTAASLTLDPALVQILVLGLAATAADVIQERSSGTFRSKIEAIGEGRLSSAITDTVGALVRGALVGCTAVAPTRRAYASGMLPAVVDAAPVAASAGIVGCAPVENGYDVAIRHPDSFTVVITVTLPRHLLADIVEAVLVLAARVLAAASDAQAHQCLRHLAAGRLNRELADAVGVALFIAVSNSAKVPNAHKNILLGYPAVEALLSRA